MNNIIYIGIMAITVFLIRALPLTIIRKPIKNNTIKSFLYYVPYVTLSIMTFPAIIDTTNNIYAGIVALLVGIISSYKEKGLFKTTVLCCLVALVIELLIKE